MQRTVWRTNNTGSEIWVANSNGRLLDLHPRRLVVPPRLEFIGEGTFIEHLADHDVRYTWHPEGWLREQTLELVGEFLQVCNACLRMPCAVH